MYVLINVCKKTDSLIIRNKCILMCVFNNLLVIALRNFQD